MIKTKSKKILSLVLTLCMVLSLLPLNAFAAVTGGPSELDTLKVGDTTIESVTGTGSEGDAYKATAYVSDYNDVKLSITLTGKDLAKLYYKASESESISADEISTEITLTSGSVSDQAITGLSSTNKYLLLKLDMEGSSSDYKYFVITVEKTPTLGVSPDVISKAATDPSVTVTLTDAKFAQDQVASNVTVNGVEGLTFESATYSSETQITVKMTGTANAAGTLTITVQPSAIQDYTGKALTTTVSVKEPGALTSLQVNETAVEGTLTAPGTKEKPAELTATLTEVATNFKIKAEFSGMTAKYGDSADAANTDLTTNVESSDISISGSGATKVVWIVTNKESVDGYYKLTVTNGTEAAKTVTLSGTTTLQEGTDGGNIVLTATDGTFADPATKENFTLSDTALTVQSVEISQTTSEKDTATLTITGTPTKAGDLTVTVKKEAFEPQAAENATATVQIKEKPAPTMTVEAKLNNGPLTQNAAISGATITLTATGDADFTAINGEPDSKYTLEGDGAAGITISNVVATGDNKTATLTLTGTPTATGDVKVKVAKDAFTPEAAEDVTATGEITVAAAPEPAKTSPLTALTVSNGSEVTITPSDLGTQSEPVALTSTLNANAESFTITATFGEATAKYSTDSMEQAESSEKALTSGSASDAINTEAAGGDTIVYIYVEGSDQQTKAYYKLTVTNPAKEEPAKTAQPTFEQTTVTAAENNQSAVFTVTNTEAYEGKEITVEVYKGADFSEKDETVTGKYADGQLTLTFQEAISAQQTYQVTFKAGEDEASDKSETLTVEVYKKTTVTPQPQADGAFEEIVADAGNKTAKVGVQNIEDYETPDNITVDVYQDTDGQKGEKADGVTGKYTEAEEAGTLTLTFNEALTKVTTYWITFTDKGSNASEAVKLVVQPVTTTPATDSADVKATDSNTKAEVTLNNQDAYTTPEGTIAVNVYSDEQCETKANGVTATYADGKISFTFTPALEKKTDYYVTFTLTPSDDSGAWAPSGALKVSVDYVPTTATPKLEGQETVEITCTSKTSAEITLTNASAYKGSPTVAVYSQATGGEAVKDPTAKYADGKITLTFTSPIETQQTYYISMTEDQKLESDRLKVIVNPYKAEEGTGITAVSTTIESDTINAVNGGTEELDGTTPEKAIPWTFNILQDQLSKLTSVTLTMESAKAKVYYLGSEEANVSDGSTIKNEGTNSDGTVTISNTFSTNKALYVKVTSEADTEGANPVYYLITVEVLKVTAADAKVTENLGTYQDALESAGLNETALNADSQKIMNQAIMDSIAADDTLTDQMDNEGTFENRESEPDTIWGKLYKANDTIVTGTITYYYVPYMDLQVTDYNVSGDDKTLTMNITPKYSVIATTADSFDNAKWTGDKAQINAIQLSTDNTVKLTNVTIDIPVPTAIGTDDATVYVVHGSDSWQCTVADSKVSVTVPSFSPFTLQSKATGAAVIDGKVYSTVQAAVDAVAKDGKITLTNAATEAELKALKAPTQLANNDTFTIEAGDSKLSVGESNVTFTDTTKDNVTYKAAMGSDGKVTITTTQLYDIKITTTGSGSITANPNPAAKDAEVTLTVSGTLKGEIKVVNYNTDEKIEAKTEDNGKTYKFTMPDSTVTVTAEFESSGGYTGGGGGSGSSATVNSSKAINGSFAISDKNAKAGDTVKVTPKANEGYVVDTVTVTDKNGKNIPVTQNADGTYSFVMPEKSAQPVDVKVTFKLDNAEKDCPSEKFTDVDQDKWYHEGVDYAIKNGLMNGTGADTFAPDATTTRAMVVTILYRLDGEPAVTKDIPFADVPAGQWYSNAINWAAANGIVNGYGDDKFGPDDTITREQMAAILYRYASYKGYSVSDLANLTGYTDAASVSEWASTAMRWAVAEGLIEGTSATTLSPSGDSTRAQVATILMRFCEGVVK